MNSKLREVLLNKAEELGWLCHKLSDSDVEFENWSPAGEDFIFCTSGDDIETEVREFADTFDTEGHVKELMDAKANGFGGVPDIKTLVKDADDIHEMLQELAEALREVGER